MSSTTNTGNVSTMDKIKAKVENVLHKDHSTTGSTTHTTGGTAEGEYGQHNSRVANAADPRVDSDLDGSRNAGLSQGTGHSALGGIGSSGVNTQHNNAGLSGHSNAHDGTHAGNHLGGTGTTGGLSNSTNAGPHDSNLANTLDPRVDSNLDGRGNRHGASTGAAAGIFGASGSHATHGSGTAQNTDGPHNSDIANQLDPRVDSDRDGSKTIGGNATRSNTNSSLDASKVTPSVFAAHYGAPEILHSGQQDHGRRHSVSHQEKLSGI